MAASGVKAKQKVLPASGRPSGLTLGVAVPRPRDEVDPWNDSTWVSICTAVGR
jgi:hypothetical protein